MIEGENLFLKIPTLEDEIKILEMVQEFKSVGEAKIVGAGGIENFENYADWLTNNLKYSNSETVPQGKVASTQFVSVRKSDGKIIGFIQLRHKLNDFLLS